jgi:hypothetical protein
MTLGKTTRVRTIVTSEHTHEPTDKSLDKFVVVAKEMSVI